MDIEKVYELWKDTEKKWDKENGKSTVGYNPPTWMLEIMGMMIEDTLNSAREQTEANMRLKKGYKDEVYEQRAITVMSFNGDMSTTLENFQV